jgi:hypothetical protein
MDLISYGIITGVWNVQDVAYYGWFWVGCFNPGGIVYTRVDTECYFICSLGILSVGVQMKMNEHLFIQH